MTAPLAPAATTPRFAPGLASFALLTLLASCFPLQQGPGPERVACLTSCGRQKDTCLVGAMSADAVQACDAQSGACNVACPS